MKYKQEESNDFEAVDRRVDQLQGFFERRERRELNSERSVTVSTLS